MILICGSRSKSCFQMGLTICNAWILDGIQIMTFQASESGAGTGSWKLYNCRSRYEVRTESCIFLDMFVFINECCQTNENNLSPSFRQVFPNGLPVEYSLTATFRVRRNSKKERWYLLQMLDQHNMPQVCTNSFFPILICFYFPLCLICFYCAGG